MSKNLRLNKTELIKRQQELVMFNRFLPMLRSKRQLFLREQQVVREKLEELQAKYDALELDLLEWVAVCVDDTVSLSTVISVESAVIAQKNIAGILIPELKSLDVQKFPFDERNTPLWVDIVVSVIEEYAHLRAQISVLQDQKVFLDAAYATANQRVNLFEKRMIPNLESDIRKITTALGDEAISAVVRAKIAQRLTSA